MKILIAGRSLLHLPERCRRGKKLFGFLLLLIFSVGSSNAVVILLHGSLATQETWWTPEGSFFKKLETSARKQGHQVIPFCWSAVPTETEITNAATVLVRIILSYCTREPVIIVAHSHGGNVVNHASNILAAMVTTALAQNSTKPTPNKPLSLANNANLEQSLCNNMQPLLDVCPTTKAVQKIGLGSFSHMFNEMTTRCTEQLLGKPYLIDRVYLLGTPVDTKRLAPNMGIINTLVSLYSEGDYIQTVLGQFGRTYPKHDRIANIATKFTHSSLDQGYWPGHSELHNDSVAQNLLSIPETFAQTRIGNFDLFRFGTTVQVTFFEKNDPILELLPNSASKSTAGNWTKTRAKEATCETTA